MGYSRAPRLHSYLPFHMLLRLRVTKLNYSGKTTVPPGAQHPPGLSHWPPKRSAAYAQQGGVRICLSARDEAEVLFPGGCRRLSQQLGSSKCLLAARASSSRL